MDPSAAAEFQRVLDEERRRTHFRPLARLSNLLLLFAFVLYTISVATYVRRTAPPCLCSTPRRLAQTDLRIEYRSENECDPSRWALWETPRGGSRKVEKKSTKGKKGKEAKSATSEQVIANVEPGETARGSSGNRQSHENPAAAREADKHVFYGDVSPGSMLPADRVLFGKFFSTGAMTNDSAIKTETPMKNGTFVEVGAGDGRTHSLTRFFEESLGWSGLLIEAATPNFAELKKVKRAKRTSKLHAAVCERPGKVEMVGRGDTARPLARAPKSYREMHAKAWGDQWSTPYNVSCNTLDRLVNGVDLGVIDLMTVSLHGDEAVALRSARLDKLQVRVLCVDTRYMTDSDLAVVGTRLRRQGFCLASRVGRNEFWTSDEALKTMHCDWSSFRHTP